jgi:hypothetical protein
MSQVERIKNLLSDGEWHSNFDLIAQAYGVDFPASARLAARINDLKNRGYHVEGKHDESNHKKYWYRMITDPVQLTFGVKTDHFARV